MKIELKKWTPQNKEELMKICNGVNRTYLRNRIPYPYTEKDAEWWLDFVDKNDGKSGVFRAVAADGVYVGNISVEQKDDVCCKDAEIGYVLLPEAESKGIMTEAAGQICGLAFEVLDIVRITGMVCEPNVASRRVLEKNNFQLEGIMKKAFFKNGSFFDECIYAVLK